MTTAHSSTTFQRALRHEVPSAAACLRLRWAVAPAALGKPGRAPLTLELELPAGEDARLTLDGQPFKCDGALSSWDGALTIRRVTSGAGAGLLIADASPLAVAIIKPSEPERPLHVACDLPKALGLRGGRYELIGGELTQR